MDDFLILKPKNKLLEKVHISDIKKIYIITNKKKNDVKMLLLIIPVLLFYDEYYWEVLLITIILLYFFSTTLFHNVKYKLIVELNNNDEIELKFKNNIKYKIIENISFIRKSKP